MPTSKYKNKRNSNYYKTKIKEDWKSIRYLKIKETQKNREVLQRKKRNKISKTKTKQWFIWIHPITLKTIKDFIYLFLKT